MEGLNKEKRKIICLYWAVSENMFDSGESLVILNIGLQTEVI